MDTPGRQPPTSGANFAAERVVILGAGGLGSIAADLCSATGRELVGFLDNRKPPGTRIYGNPVLGPFDLLERDAELGKACRFIVAVGEPRLRREWLGRIAGAGGRLVNLIHPSVSRSPSARLGDGIMICPYTNIYPGVEIADGCLIEGRCTLGPEVSVMTVCVIAEGAILGLRTRIGADSFIGAAAVTRPNVTVGQGCVIGMNSTVIRDIPPFKVAVGSPARVLRDNADLSPGDAEQNRQDR